MKSLPITTRRLELRPFQPGDVDDVHAYASDPVITRYTDWGPNVLQETRSFVQEAIDALKATPLSNISLAIEHRDSRRVIGTVGLQFVQSELGDASIGFCINREFWGKGFATEAAQSFLDWASDEFQLRRIYATCRPDNRASARVLEKLGMIREGRLRKNVQVDGRWRDSLVYALAPLDEAVDRLEPELLFDIAVDDVGSNGRSERIYRTGEHLRLRRPRMADAEPRYRWFADPQVTRYLPLAGKGELPMDDIRNYLEKVIASERPIFDVSIELEDGTTIGSASFRDIVEGDSAELSIVIGEADARGRGLGREAMELMLDYGFDEMNLERIWLVVRADNEPAVGLFESLGFRTVEVLEDAVMVDGVAYDKLRMELAREVTDAMEG